MKMNSNKSVFCLCVPVNTLKKSFDANPVENALFVGNSKTNVIRKRSHLFQGSKRAQSKDIRTVDNGVMGTPSFSFRS